jgi:Glycosyl hydrolases related to GH101 family, GH129/Carbohydrate binding domain/Family of unknown function (DUF5696)
MISVVCINRALLMLCCLGGWVCLSAAPVQAGAASEQLLSNGDFEKGTEGWNALWAREPGAAKAVLDDAERHGGAHALRIEHTGQRDWSLAHSLNPAVQPGEIYELTAWVRVQGAGSATLGVVTRDASGKTLDWAYGGRSMTETKGWRCLRSRFIIPPATATICPRLIGDGPATIWCDDFVLARQGSLAALRGQGLPPAVTISNAAIGVTLQTADATFAVRDQRANRTWVQGAAGAHLIVLGAKADGRAIDLKLLDPVSMHEMGARVRLNADTPEMVVVLRGEGEMDAPLTWPAPFASAKGQLLILPVNEGISYPADDESLPAMHYYLYGGHGLCMPWYGAVEADTGWMAIVETPDDAAVSIPRRDGLLGLVPVWEPQKQRFGVERVIRYVFLDGGGYVAMAKRYREYAKQTRLLKTMDEKRKSVPAVDLLVGAVNIWCWDRDAASWCRELRACGIERILWSNALPPDQIKALNDLGVLTSRYDIYQDAMDAANFPRLRWAHPDWTSEAWTNDDLMIGADGQWVRGWEVETKDGKMVPCGTLCDRQAVAYAKQRIPPDLATHPYRSRFIDTTTASPWRECYHPKHPMTRTESKRFKMDLLQYISEGCGLVCGSETGHDAAVPFVHYFEGMLSLGPYRVPDAGRAMMRAWDEVPEPVAKFQTGRVYRLPLWELVYHDCVVAQWYWGDYNNKLPKLWDRRDLWNALYGTPPMFMFNRQVWDANKDRFVKSYQTATAVARVTGYSQMVSHEWLTPDHAIQRTRFANGVGVTVNFGDTPWSPPGGKSLPSMECRVEGLKRP